MNTLCIIPARGGSKGVLKKNLRIVAGKPLVAHSIAQALATTSIQRVIVSTDDAAIADLTAHMGAEPLMRPSEISGDTASSESALLHVLDTLRETEQYEPDAVVFLQPTSPLRGASDIADALNQFKTDNADSLFSAAEIECFLWSRNQDQVTPLNYDPLHRPRRQDRPPLPLCENGSIYIFKPHVLQTFGSRIGGVTSAYIMPWMYSFQIDTEKDISLMEGLFLQAEKVQSHYLLRDVRLIVFDFDGVMTDNRVLVDENGKEAVYANRSDGLGMGMLLKAGYDVLVISTEKNPVVEMRCKKLGIPSIQGCDEKLSALKQAAAERNLAAKQIAYVGNDSNDTTCMQWAGVPIAVHDAHPDVLPYAKIVTQACGGAGVVRELASLLIPYKTR